MEENRSRSDSKPQFDRSDVSSVSDVTLGRTSKAAPAAFRLARGFAPRGPSTVRDARARGGVLRLGARHRSEPRVAPHGTFASRRGRAPERLYIAHPPVARCHVARGGPRRGGRGDARGYASTDPAGRDAEKDGVSRGECHVGQVARALAASQGVGRIVRQDARPDARRGRVVPRVFFARPRGAGEPERNTRTWRPAAELLSLIAEAAADADVLGEAFSGKEGDVPGPGARSASRCLRRGSPCARSRSAATASAPRRRTLRATRGGAAEPAQAAERNRRRAPRKRASEARRAEKAATLCARRVWREGERDRAAAEPRHARRGASNAARDRGGAGGSRAPSRGAGVHRRERARAGASSSRRKRRRRGYAASRSGSRY